MFKQMGQEYVFSEFVKENNNVNWVFITGIHIFKGLQ